MSKPYLTFASANPFTVATSEFWPWYGTMFYSVDSENWREYEGDPVASAEYKGEHCVFLRGTGNTSIGPYGPVSFVFDGEDIRCDGNIENLLDYTVVAAGEHPTMAANCFLRLFEGCTNLISAPELPATTLSLGCYDGMFWGCTGLRVAPELPAITLATECYMSMFRDCTGLTTAPELPATTLAMHCYSFMFSGCTGLTTAPELPATTLSASCYLSMFKGCAGIKLHTAQQDVYWKEYRIPTSGEGTTATSALNDMFADTGGLFTGTPEINTVYYMSAPRQYTISYITDHGIAPASMTFYEVHEITEADLPVLTAEGYTFKGWSLTDGGETIGAGFAIAADITLYAVWEEAPSEPTEMDKASMMLGYLVGRQIAGQRNGKKIPTAYLYNGVRLPALPEWDREEYPYAYINDTRSITNGYHLVAITHPIWGCDLLGEYLVNDVDKFWDGTESIPSKCIVYKCDTERMVWELVESVDGTGVGAMFKWDQDNHIRPTIWSSVDIDHYIYDSTVPEKWVKDYTILVGTEPVPVTGGV